MGQDSDTYARQLQKLRHGLPLWFPDCPDKEIQIGDVGYVDSDGAFVCLFNATLPVGHPDNCEGTPADYIPLRIPPNLLNMKTQYLDAQYVCSSTVSASKIEGELGSNAAYSLISYRFISQSDEGAVLFLKGGASKIATVKNDLLPEYMKRNYQHWHDLACSMRWSIGRDDLEFVYGCVKTTEWAVAAFTHRGHTHEVLVKGGVPQLGKAGLDLSYSTKHSSPGSKRMGPQSPRNGCISRDQCVFLLRYKIKRRPLLPLVIYAAAGAHILPEPDRDGDGSDSNVRVDVEVEDEPSYREEPLNPLLDYLLSTTPEAECAIAADEDLDELCKLGGITWPNDWPTYLNTMKPSVKVVESGKVVMFGLETNRAMSQKNISEAFSILPNVASSPPTSIVSPSAFATPLTRTSRQPIKHEPHATGSFSVIYKPSYPTSDTSRCTCIVVSRELVCGGFKNGIILLWDWIRGLNLLSLSTYSPLTAAIAISANARQLAYCALGSAFYVIDLGQRKLIHTLAGHLDRVNVIAYSPDGKVLASGSDDETVLLWDARTGEVIAKLHGHESPIQTLSFSPDGTLLASSAGQIACIWALSSTPTVINNSVKLNPLAILTGHNNAIWSIAFSSDSTRLATGSEDHTTRVYHATTGEQLTVIQEHSDSIREVDFSLDGQEIISHSNDGTVSVCDAATGSRRLLLRTTPSASATCAKFSPDGRRIAVGRVDGRVEVWESSTGRLVIVFDEGYKDKINSLYFSPDGSAIILLSDNGSILSGVIPRSVDG